MPFSVYRITGKQPVRALNTLILLAVYAISATAAQAGNTHSASVPDHDLALGKRVFTTTCLSCHGKGAHGAPRRDSTSDWAERLKQHQDTLARHAIDGHGRMPPKGGFSALSDAEVEAAVAYVVDRSRKIVIALEERNRKKRCNSTSNPNACSDKDMDMDMDMDMEEVMTLHMLWLLVNTGD